MKYNLYEGSKITFIKLTFNYNSINKQISELIILKFFHLKLIKCFAKSKNNFFKKKLKEKNVLCKC